MQKIFLSKEQKTILNSMIKENFMRVIEGTSYENLPCEFREQLESLVPDIVKSIVFRDKRYVDATFWCDEVIKKALLKIYIEVRNQTVADELQPYLEIDEDKVLTEEDPLMVKDDVSV